MEKVFLLVLLIIVSGFALAQEDILQEAITEENGLSVPEAPVKLPSFKKGTNILF